MAKASSKKAKRFAAKKIREARKFSRLSQKALAQKLGVSDKTVSAWESQRAEPSLDMLYDIGSSTDKPINFFLKDQKDEYTVPSKLSAIEKELSSVRKLLRKTKK